ncbi:MAG TPA: 2Fe-2S iron-sulfur cluster-binding protein [Verrucomicrobiales bacterium]|nr:2Fe-2S iron-sulfur cluster-binding protein [Verrucomicrobiales bacterium]
MPDPLVEFPGTSFPCLRVLPGRDLSLALTSANSPVLFGCRSGLCGTCLVEVEAIDGELEPPADSEREPLELYAPGNPKARLACQLRLTQSVRIRTIQSL